MTQKVYTKEVPFEMQGVVKVDINLHLWKLKKLHEKGEKFDFGKTSYDGKVVSFDWEKRTCLIETDYSEDYNTIVKMAFTINERTLDEQTIVDDNFKVSPYIVTKSCAEDDLRYAQELEEQERQIELTRQAKVQEIRDMVGSRCWVKYHFTNSPTKRRPKIDALINSLKDKQTTLFGWWNGSRFNGRTRSLELWEGDPPDFKIVDHNPLEGTVEIEYFTPSPFDLNIMYLGMAFMIDTKTNEFLGPIGVYMMERKPYDDHDEEYRHQQAILETILKAE